MLFVPTKHVFIQSTKYICLCQNYFPCDRSIIELAIEFVNNSKVAQPCSKFSLADNITWAPSNWLGVPIRTILGPSFISYYTLLLLMIGKNQPKDLLSEIIIIEKRLPVNLLI